MEICKVLCHKSLEESTMITRDNIEDFVFYNIETSPYDSSKRYIHISHSYFFDDKGCVEEYTGLIKEIDEFKKCLGKDSDYIGKIVSEAKQYAEYTEDRETYNRWVDSELEVIKNGGCKICEFLDIDFHTTPDGYYYGHTNISSGVVDLSVRFDYITYDGTNAKEVYELARKYNLVSEEYENVDSQPFRMLFRKGRYLCPVEVEAETTLIFIGNRTYKIVSGRLTDKEVRKKVGEIVKGIL